MVSRDFLKKISPKIGHTAFFPATSKKSFFRFRQKVVVSAHFRRVTSGKKRWRKGIPPSRNYAYLIDFVLFFLQNMSDRWLKCLAKGLIVTKTSFHAGFWYLSRIKRPTRSPNRKTFCDVCHLWSPFSDLLGTCGLLFGAAHLWSETNFFRDSNPCGLHSRAVYNPTNTVACRNPYKFIILCLATTVLAKIAQLGNR